MPAPRHAQPLTHPDDLASRELFTYAEAAQKLRCCKRTVEKLVASGKLRSTRYLTKNLISSRALCEFIDRHEHRLRRVSPTRPE